MVFLLCDKPPNNHSLQPVRRGKIQARTSAGAKMIFLDKEKR
jgi:hypothetical protein